MKNANPWVGVKAGLPTAFISMQSFRKRYIAMAGAAYEIGAF